MAHTLIVSWRLGHLLCSIPAYSKQQRQLQVFQLRLHSLQSLVSHAVQLQPPLLQRKQTAISD